MKNSQLCRRLQQLLLAFLEYLSKKGQVVSFGQPVPSLCRFCFKSCVRCWKTFFDGLGIQVLKGGFRYRSRKDGKPTVFECVGFLCGAMGKYQLDYKGMQQVERFHEKHSTVKTDKKARVQALKQQFLEKTKKK